MLWQLQSHSRLHDLRELGVDAVVEVLLPLAQHRAGGGLAV